MSGGTQGFGKLVRLGRAAASSPRVQLTPRDIELRRVVNFGGLAAAVAIGILQAYFSEDKSTAALCLVMAPLVGINYAFAWEAFDWPLASRYLLAVIDLALLSISTYAMSRIEMSEWPVVPTVGLYLFSVLFVVCAQLRSLHQETFQRQHE